jgi:Zn-finger nucleic acid-binding protein
MREVVHGAVTIDTCTQCRGVWLDRGELEKIAASIGDGRDGRPQQAAYEDPRGGYRRGHDDDDDDDRRDYNRGGQPPQKRGMTRFLDFFD